MGIRYLDEPGTKIKYLDEQKPSANPSLSEIGQGIRHPWDVGLKLPEKYSRQGLQEITQGGTALQNAVANKTGLPIGTEPTGNLPADIIRNTPRIAGETLSEVAPGFVSRGAILAAGAAPFVRVAGKALAPVGKSIASGLEDWSGIRSKGALVKAAQDPTLIFSRIPQSARDAYAAGNEAVAESPLSKIPSPLKMVQKALGLAQKGKLSPEEAVEARKAVDQLWRSNQITSAFKSTSRAALDAVAKSDEAIADADSAFSRGKTAASLRSIFPKNVGGRASPFKVAEGIALANMGPVGKVASAMFSPLALGSAATAGGVAGRIAANPAASATATQVLRRLRKKDEDPNP